MDSELMSLDDEDIQQRLHANKDDVLEKIRQALSEAGLHEYEVKSVNLFLRRLPLRCPAGQHPVWDAVRKPDGTVVYEWVCKQSG
jgi:hypothetical protein